MTDWEQPALVARLTDPATSWEAARSVEHVRESQLQVFRLLQDRGPSTDEALIQYARESGWPITDSGLRTRRSELVRLGWVEDSGDRGLTAAGRRTIVWRIVRATP
jgi:hypothetical protein